VSDITWTQQVSVIHHFSSEVTNNIGAESYCEIEESDTGFKVFGYDTRNWGGHLGDAETLPEAKAIAVKWLNQQRATS
jgi:hypothetical protein